ncbi:hypothetical protein ACTWQF_32005 [Streptomyces sp. 8N114]|uniref:hypothetical protein n=1 Tax=Streptomyces sp. 8N114 TaxID=3457419 RepID=UPI003FD1A4EC
MSERDNERDEGHEQRGHSWSARLRTLRPWVIGLSGPAAFMTFIAVWIGRNAWRLVTGESATVRMVSRCVEGGGLSLPGSHCDGSWVFADGRTGVGEITGETVSVGDTVFAGDGWAYSSTAPLHRLVWIPSGIFCALGVVVLVMWVNYRREQHAEGGLLSGARWSRWSRWWPLRRG